jgi:hypothetical protein
MSVTASTPLPVHHHLNPPLMNSVIPRIDEVSTEVEQAEEQKMNNAREVNGQQSSSDCDESGCEASIVEEHRTFIRIGTTHRSNYGKGGAGGSKQARRALRRVRSFPRSYRKVITAATPVTVPPVGNGPNNFGPVQG